MHFTLWPSARANVGGYGETSWEAFLGFVSTPTIAPDKAALEGWSPAKFTGNRRAKANVEAVSAIVLDDDASGLPIADVHALWADVAGLAHTSPSHTEAKPKFRIVLRVSRDMTPAEHAIVWGHCAARAAARGQTLDAATRDPSRLWYVPAHREGAPYAWCELTGAPLDVDAILAMSPSADTPAKSPNADTAPRAPALPDARRRAMALALGASWPANGRHEAQLALAGALRSEGFAEAEAVDFLCAVCAAAGDEDRPKREATCRHTYAKPEGSALTSWTRLKSFVDPLVVDAARTALAHDAEWSEHTTRKLAEASALGAPVSPAPLKLATGPTVTLGGIVFETGGYDAKLPPITWQIDRLIGRGEVVMFVAQGNSLKTWVGFSLAHAIAAGRPWLGQYVVQRGRAALIDFESGRYEVLRRLQLLGVRDAEVDDRLLRSSYPQVKFLDPETWVQLGGYGLEFLAIDSFNAAAPETDENDARSAIMLQHAGRFAEATSCTVAFVHHARKGSGGDEREAVRGSTALYAACDRIFLFADVEKAEGGIVRATMRSIKDGAGRSPADVRVELSDQGLRFVEGEAKPVEEPAQEANRKLIVEQLRRHTGGVPKSTLVDAMKGKREDRFALLAQMALVGLTTEFRTENKTWIMKKPGIEL